MKTYDIDNHNGEKRFENSLFIALKENILGRIMTSMFSVIYLTLSCLQASIAAGVITPSHNLFGYKGKKDKSKERKKERKKERTKDQTCN